ncbi:MAG: BamA/TamA family outer membrane protein [Rikenellaceae bacterium]
MRFFIANILLLLFFVGCNTTRYVPQGESLLVSNKVNIKAPKGISIDKDALKEYVQQRPNRKLLGIGIYQWFYNITDTSKHNGWHRFWAEKVGEAPVVLDSSMVAKSSSMMNIYLESMGFLNATVSDTIEVSSKRKSTVTYDIKTSKPFVISSIKYNIEDKFLKPLILADSVNSLLKVGGRFERKALEAERARISDMLRNEGFWSFSQNDISYTADSTLGNSTVRLQINVAMIEAGRDAQGKVIYENHPLYRISEIIMNSDFDPTLSEPVYDILHYRGVDILYRDKLLIKEQYLLEQLGMSPGEIFNQQSIEQTYTNVRSLGFTPTIIFSPLPVDSSDMVMVSSIYSNELTTERELSCLVKCTPVVRQNFQVDFEGSTTESYFSVALRLGYQNHNLFGGAEDFSVSARGAYELMWSQGTRNSFEFGVSTSISVPRFWLPISAQRFWDLNYASTKLSLSYNVQRRPYYDRSVYSVVYGYGWTLKNGARFTINPADVNVIDVPWVDESFLDSIANPYLKNSYESQLISGLSASYYYTTNADTKLDGFTFRVTGDVNGNLFYGLSNLFNATQYTADAGDNYYTLFGLRYAQYIRMMGEVSGRTNVGQRSQLAWRTLLGAGYAYGNSSVIPFERQYFAGGSNSMRGWQVRTLGPGSVYIEDYGDYPDQQGDMRFEANFEYRVNVVGGFNLGFFLDCGNIWMNGEGEDREEARFNITDFYNDLALNTGLGVRYDLGFFVLRVDWGIKLRNPNETADKVWFGNLSLNQTALHFAIGLPF